MYDFPFDAMTSAELLTQLAELPASERSEAVIWLFGWMQADLTDKQRARAFNALLAESGAMVLLPVEGPPVTGDSPLAP